MSIKTVCSNCDLGLKRKDCCESEFNICMAKYYISKLDNMLPTTIVDDVLAPSLDFIKFKSVAIEMIKKLN
jgi:hypothetical protein